MADYEAHMALPYVDQARLLSDIFGSALDKYTPRSVALLGCAGGNGFEQVMFRGIPRLVGIDINAEYIEKARDRWHARITGLELFVGDLQVDKFDFAPVDLVFAGLLFEYVDIGQVLTKIHSMLCPEGVLVTVVQLPSPECSEITPSPFTSLKALSEIMRLVPPESLHEKAENCGYREIEKYVVDGKSGKKFCVQSFAIVF